MSLRTADYTLDQQSWALSVVLESTFSTHANREAPVNFTLQLRDVCWDLPYTTFNAVQSFFVFDIWSTHSLQHDLLIMQGSWGDYCTGSSYRLEYVSGPKLPSGGDPLTVDINSFYADKTSYNTPGLSGLPYFQGTQQDVSWEGIHTVRIKAQQGTTKLYRSFYSSTFTIEYRNPCRTCTVTAQVLTNMETTVDDKTKKTQTYIEFKDNVSTLYGNGYDKCGPRVHYLTDLNNDHKTVPGNIYRISEFLYFYQATTGVPPTPNTYTFEVQTSNYASIGLHNYRLHVGLLNYPTATEAVVPWSVKVNPCIVTSYQAPTDYTWNYVIGSLASNFIFNFNQAPCRYTQKLSAKLVDGGSLPRSMTLGQTGEGYFRVFASNTTDLGKYEVIVTGELSNLDIFGDPMTTISPELRISKANPPATFIY